MILEKITWYIEGLSMRCRSRCRWWGARSITDICLPVVVASTCCCHLVCRYLSSMVFHKKVFLTSIYRFQVWPLQQLGLYFLFHHLTGVVMAMFLINGVLNFGDKGTTKCVASYLQTPTQGAGVGMLSSSLSNCLDFWAIRASTTSNVTVFYFSLSLMFVCRGNMKWWKKLYMAWNLGFYSGIFRDP